MRYQERLLVEGVNADYILNKDLNYVQLRRSFPADTALLGISSLTVTYTPVPQQGVGGDRQVLGFDTQFSPAPGSRVNLQFGQSQGITKQNSGTGLVFSATLGSRDGQASAPVRMGNKDPEPRAPLAPLSNGERFQPSWNASLGFRNIEPGFSSIESTAAALLRAEKGFKGSFGYSPNPNWTYDLALNDSTISQNSTSTTSSTTTTSTLTSFRSQTSNFGASWAPTASGSRKLPRVRFSHAGTNQGSGTNTATFTSDQLSTTYDIPKGSVEASLYRSASKGRSIFAYGYTGTVGTGLNSSSGGLLGGYRDGTTAQTSTNSSSDSAQLRLNLTPRSNLTIATSIGLTNNTVAGGRSRGRDTSFATTYSPIPEKLQLQVDLTDTTNGQNLSGFYNGSGGDTLGGASTGQRTRSRNFRLSFTPTQRLRVETGLLNQLSLIPGYDNTQSTTSDLSMDYTVSQKVKLLGQWSKQGTTYVGSESDSDNQNYILQATAGPYKRMNFTASAARMNFGSVFSSLSSSSGLGSIGSGLGGLGSSGLTGGFGQNGLTNTLVLRSTYTVSLKQRSRDSAAPARETPLLPFFEWRLLNASSPKATGTTPSTGTGSSSFHNALNYRNNELRLGTEWGVSSLLSASFDIRFVQMTDHDSPQFSYRARTLNFDLKARFN